jgi:uncharacterized membrane protein
MKSRARILGHAIHPIMIVFPLGLLSTGVIFDVIYLFTDNTTFATVAHYMIASGIIGGFAAAVFGFIDWLAIPSNTRAKSVGVYHAAVNSVALVLFIGSWWLRRDAPQSPELTATILSLAGAGLSMVGGWFGGELVERLGVGVDPGAHLDAPNSLTEEDASRKAAHQ